MNEWSSMFETGLLFDYARPLRRRPQKCTPPSPRPGRRPRGSDSSAGGPRSLPRCDESRRPPLSVVDAAAAAAAAASRAAGSSPGAPCSRPAAAAPAPRPPPPRCSALATASAAAAPTRSPPAPSPRCSLFRLHLLRMLLVLLVLPLVLLRMAGSPRAVRGACEVSGLGQA